MKVLGLYSLAPANGKLLSFPPGPQVLSILSSAELNLAPSEQPPTNGTTVADVKLRDSNNGPLGYLIPRQGELRLDGVAPLTLAMLHPGTLLSIGARRWFVTTQWQPEPSPAPAELAERKCPVCGGELKLAPVVQCTCGRYYHLEKPDAAASEPVLNCFLAGACGLCNRPPSLEPVLTPEPPEKLMDVVSGEW